MIDESRYTGCFKGLAIGDAYGALYEGGLLERWLWRLIGRTSNGRKRYTDDTQMSLDVAHSFLENKGIAQDHLARTFSASYRWSRGYGPSAAKLLLGIRKGKDWRVLNRSRFKDGSKGNGAAMRAPVVALCHPVNDGTLRAYIEQTAEITHAHPHAIEGAYLIAVATTLLLNDTPNEEVFATLLACCESDLYRSKLQRCKAYCLSESELALKAIRDNLGNGIIASESCITALYFGLRYREYELETMHDKIFLLGGDTDTIAAMAGGLWGASNGDATIAHLEGAVEDIEVIEDLAKQLHAYYVAETHNVYTRHP